MSIELNDLDYNILVKNDKNRFYNAYNNRSYNEELTEDFAYVIAKICILAKDEIPKQAWYDIRSNIKKLRLMIISDDDLDALHPSMFNLNKFETYEITDLLLKYNKTIPEALIRNIIDINDYYQNNHNTSESYIIRLLEALIIKEKNNFKKIPKQLVDLLDEVELHTILQNLLLYKRFDELSEDNWNLLKKFRTLDKALKLKILKDSDIPDYITIEDSFRSFFNKKK